MINYCQVKRVKKRSSGILPSELSSENNDSFAHETTATETLCLVPRRYAPLLYAATYFCCMVVVDFTIEGTQNAFPDLLALPYATTLFQFSFCFLLPVAISKGETIFNLPKSIIEISPYIVLSVVIFTSSVCKSASARYVSFPTKVIFRSTKLIPVMIVASMLHINKQRKYGRLDFLAAMMLCAGAAGYSFGEAKINDDKQDSYFGILLLTGSVFCDATTPNIQQWLMNPANPAEEQPVAVANREKTIMSSLPSSSSLSSLTPSLPDIIISDSTIGSKGNQVVAKRLSRKVQPLLLNRGGLGLSASSLMTNAYAVGCVGLLVFMTGTGHLDDAVREAMVSPNLFANLTLIGISMSIAVFAHTRLIKESGAVTAVTVTTLREFVTVLLSYIIYPKIFSTLHAVSAMLVFGGILLSSYVEYYTGSEHNSNGIVGASPARVKTRGKIELVRP